jgi:hypothetical protein
MREMQVFNKQVNAAILTCSASLAPLKEIEVLVKADTFESYDLTQ